MSPLLGTSIVPELENSMQHTEHELEALNTLIDSAAKQVGGKDAKLAATLCVTRQRLSDWRSGRKTCQPEDQALMASIAGLNAMETLARATVQQHEGTVKGDLLMRALGKGLLATGAAIGSAGASAAGTFSSTATGSEMVRRALVALDTMYRTVKSLTERRSINIMTKAPI